MKRFVGVMMAILMMIAVSITPAYALSGDKSSAIQTLLDDAGRISGVPGMSLSIVGGDETHYFASGFANREQSTPSDEETLYELASVSKAFTAAGILLLEEQGKLSMTDSVQDYLPWFTLRYQGQPVDMSTLTLSHFLYHTSGLTNGEHIQFLPQGDTPDMLRKTVEMLVDDDLAFSPGERYESGTVNYDVLGLVIEVVSGQSYDEFMAQQVFEPLGLHHTYASREQAEASGLLAQGYRTSFFITTPSDAPRFDGNKPAGYLMSSAADMARWMGIQMGTVTDIPEAFKAVVASSHRGDTSVAAVDDSYYAAGWTIRDAGTLIEHAGGNPDFSTEVMIFPEEQVALCLLTNSANTDIEVVASIKAILDGDLSQSYHMSARQILDIAASCMTIATGLAAVLFLIAGLRRRKRDGSKRLTKRRMILIAAWGLVTAMCFVLCWMLPSLSGYDWTTMLIWQTYSILTCLISLTLMCATIMWFVAAPYVFSGRKNEPSSG